MGIKNTLTGLVITGAMLLGGEKAKADWVNPVYQVPDVRYPAPNQSYIHDFNTDRILIRDYKGPNPDEYKVFDTSTHQYVAELPKEYVWAKIDGDNVLGYSYPNMTELYIYNFMDESFTQIYSNLVHSGSLERLGLRRGVASFVDGNNRTEGIGVTTYDLEKRVYSTYTFHETGRYNINALAMDPLGSYILCDVDYESNKFELLNIDTGEIEEIPGMGYRPFDIHGENILAYSALSEEGPMGVYLTDVNGGPWLELSKEEDIGIDVTFNSLDSDYAVWREVIGRSLSPDNKFHFEINMYNINSGNISSIEWAEGIDIWSHDSETPQIYGNTLLFRQGNNYYYTQIPEPSGLELLAIGGLIGVGALTLRRKQKGSE